MFNPKPFPVVSPESVGIPSSCIGSFLDALEEADTQLHGLMVMRHGKICAQGWWAPYAPGKRHTCHSLTKTYMGTAVGIAIWEGLLSLSTTLGEIFPEYAEDSPVAEATIQDLLSMGIGVESMPKSSSHWVADFFHQPQIHPCGTAFYYNSAGATLIAYIIERVSGQPVYAYLKPRLFEIIGIDTEVSFPTEISKEMDMWGHRMQATTEDNLRLMRLYAQGGQWEGKQILSEEFVQLATSFRNDTAKECTKNPIATDNACGYGFMMWMCKYPGAYRADGAGGQFSVVIPALDIQISITECANGARGAQQVLDCIWTALLPGVQPSSLSENAKEWKKLQSRLATLAIPAPPYSAKRCMEGTFRYRLISGFFDFSLRDAVDRSPTGEPEGNLTICLSHTDGEIIWWGNLAQTAIQFSMDGSWHRSRTNIPDCNARECYAAAWWNEVDELEIRMEWTEAVQGKHLTLHFAEDRLTIHGKTDYMPYGEQYAKPVWAEFKMERP